MSVTVTFEFTDGGKRSILVKTKKQAALLLSDVFHDHNIWGENYVIRIEHVRNAYIEEAE